MKKHLLYIGNQLSKHGYNKTTIETLGQQLEQEHYLVVYASDKKSFPFRMLDMVCDVFKYSNKVSYLLIDTYSTKAFWYAFVCSQFARILSIKYIPILHGGDLPNRLKRNPRLCRLVFANAYCNVAPSGYLKQAFEQEGYSNVLHIPNTIALENYTFKQRVQFAPKLLWVRAFASIYNPMMAVKVLVDLQKKYPKATLTMVGPDKDGSLLTTKTFASDASVPVTFTGKLSKEDWWQLASTHDIFMNTTHFDNTPVSVMEAMALGLPVVSTNVGGIPFLLTHEVDALLVDDADVSAMVEAIERLLAHPEETQQMVLNAKHLVAQMDWQVVKKQWINLLD